MEINKILDLITEETFLISDTHFYHKNIFTFEPERKVSMEKEGFSNHEEWLISNWNNTIKENDIVLHLGDFGFSRVEETLKKLNGIIILVLGNHDDKATAQKLRLANPIGGFYVESGVEGMPFKLSHPDPMFSGFIKEINGQKCLFSHYPVFDKNEWDRKNKKIAPRIKVLETIYKAHECDFSIHGHIHSNNSAFENSINASIEHLDYKPVKLKNLLKK